MKKFLFILTLMIVTATGLLAQEGEEPEGNQKIRDKMNEYIQKRLRVTEAESEKFTPVFLRYFKEWRTTLIENRGDKLVMQQKVIDLRLRYRNEFREVLGEKRGNLVYGQQDRFIKEMRELGQQRLRNRPVRNNRSLIY